MKPIQITQKQKEKLLEMCKVLFPEFTFTLDIEPQYDGSQDYIFVIEESLSSIGEPIHWFEFCMTHLIDKIFLPCGESRLDGLKFIEFHRVHNKAHLVNAIYEQFKKLKHTTIETKAPKICNGELEIISGDGDDGLGGTQEMFMKCVKCGETGFYTEKECQKGCNTLIEL